MNRKCAHVLAFCLAWVALAAVSMGQNMGRELSAELAVQSPADVSDSKAAGTDRLSGAVGKAAAAKAAPALKPRDRNEDIYYRNKVELSLEGGVLPINIPFVFDAFVGDSYTQNPTHYTLVPVFPSLRWQMGKISAPWILRGNTDLTVTFSVTAIPRGPENLYDAFDLGFRRNFVPRNWKATPYFETRIGAGFINAQEFNENTFSSLPGDAYAQGQNFTFTLMVGFGARYNFNSKYSAEVGGMYMHVSNLYLSQPKWDDNGINVCGPWIGFNMRLSKPKDPLMR
ncbi:MAG: acyloxyacyl hydrolase [Acidobacteriaceae bacterium]|jgi:hypothetical protein